MRLFKNKLIVTLPVIVIAVIFIFSLAMIPGLNPAPRNLPIAIVNEDQGLATPGVNTGKMIVSDIQSETWANPDGEPAVKWIEAGSEAEVKAGLDNQEYYAALVISKDFSGKQASLMTPDPSSPRMQIYINQGMNASASSMAGQMLNQAVNSMNEKLRAELLAAIGQQGAMLSTKQAAALASPIVSEIINVNATGTHNGNGNSPVLMLQPLWMASLIGNVVFLLVKNKQNYMNRKERVRANIIQVIWGTVIALAAGFSFTWFAGSLGVHISHFTDTAIFLAIAYLAFFLMIAAVFAWIGLKGMIIFVLLLFFGAPLLSFGPEFLSPFYRNWILSWLPMRFMVDGLRELLFFGQRLRMNHPTFILIWIGTGGLLVLLASAFRRSRTA
ncbi:YhgE/Pip domain-containing protein [Paenibacillus jilunlii]|uniref:Phage infection protein n=1 Tax=Paenibacillus jilunlii TaxID=682956 RepID=A0A1G9M6Y1_9BACL|nr:ABC transporter permease [Paenibacillus jilunlii]KWX70584.1 phage infection protein [Paenibacillus jilunlii]SDL69884.1 YhgE/Pip N-terminal domain-containing protein [Paenibacillus jilunlii]